MTRCFFSALAAWMAALLIGHAAASPADSVITPDIEEGEREIELAFGADRSDAGERSRGLLLSFGTGVTDRWATEFGLEFEKEGDEDFEFGGVEWENRLGLIVDDEAPMAVSVFLGLEKPRERAEGWSGTVGLLTESTPGRFLVNANLLVSRIWGESPEPGAAAGEDADGATLGYQWQALYRHSHRVYYGLQGMGEVGEWNDWAARDAQNHRLGPAVFGRVKLDEGERLNYDLALLFGLADGSPDQTLRFKLEYEF